MDITNSQAKNKIAILLGIGIFPFFINGFYNPHITKYPLLYWAVEILAWVVLPFIIYKVCTRNDLVSRKEIGFYVGLSNNQSLFDLLLAIFFVSFFLVFLDFIVMSSIVQAIYPINYLGVNFGYRSMIPQNPGLLRIATLIYFALSAGVVEEFYYRGLMRKVFNKGFYYVLVSSIIFSLVHWEGGVRSLTSAFVFGLAASSISLYTKNIWPLVIGHFLNDLLWFR